jgi:hypothetical protein
MFALLRAVALRDVDRVAAAGGELFASDYQFDDSNHLALALMATAASNIAINKPGAALELIDKNAERTPQTASSALALRWISAIAASQVNGGSTPEALARAR